MTHTYDIEGMTCNSCVAKVKSELLKIGAVTEADVQLPSHARISMSEHIPTMQLQRAVSAAGNFTIHESQDASQEMTAEGSTGFFAVYKPVLLIGAYLLGITMLIEFANQPFDVHRWMRHFMGGFFITFSFFKMLDLKGFADSYSTYDIVTKRWHAWGYIYPVAELSLGLAFLANFQPLIINSITLLVMSVSLIGVVQSVMKKNAIRCACLGTVFNLPMSTITIIEDALMILMSGAMIAAIL